MAEEEGTVAAHGAFISSAAVACGRKDAEEDMSAEERGSRRLRAVL